MYVRVQFGHAARERFDLRREAATKQRRQAEGERAGRGFLLDATFDGGVGGGPALRTSRWRRSHLARHHQHLQRQRPQQPNTETLSEKYANRQEMTTKVWS